MNFLTKNKYNKLARKLNELDTQFSSLIGQCKSDIEEVFYLPLSEHETRVYEEILQDILKKSEIERDKIKKGLRMVDSMKDQSTNSAETERAKLLVNSIIIYGQKHVEGLVNVHNDILDAFKIANLKKKAIMHKILSDNEESERN